jgi:microsomal epoxide hydrolase
MTLSAKPPRPYRIAVPDAVLARIRARLADADWSDPIAGGGWDYGVDLGYLKALVEHWLKRYDWRAVEAELNRHPHFLAEIDGLDVHFVHVRSKAPGALPLVITHGWPGSFTEFMHVIAPLADPAAHGGDPADAFDVIVPSMPGYGFSAKPARPIGPRRVAAMWRALMVDALGYRRFAAQGGDWGSAVTTWLGHDHAADLAGIHLNMITMRPGDTANPTEVERDWQKTARAIMDVEGAYFREQATKPQTLGVGLMDSPLGTAAWILEKFKTWSDVGDDLARRYTMDQLITNIMVYLVTRTINTANWMYRGVAEERSGKLPTGSKVRVPTGIAVFPGDFVPFPPRSWVERMYDVARWTEMPEGGHFAAMEEPARFVEDLRAFFRPLRRA